MAAAKQEAVAPIIIKRVKNHGHAPHGGSWKVAFADFATAMMAFFLLMWLIGATDEKQKGAISEYFNSNWELSADRANAARRAMVAGGLPPGKIGRVVGLASSVLLDTQAPESPLNRRISIIVMNKRTEGAISQENGALFSVQDPGARW